MPDASSHDSVSYTPLDVYKRQNESLILQAAEKVFAEAGFGGATMQLIADMAGLPKANLHYYFTSKEELYRKVVQKMCIRDSFQYCAYSIVAFASLLLFEQAVIFDDFGAFQRQKSRNCHPLFREGNKRPKSKANH